MKSSVSVSVGGINMHSRRGKIAQLTIGQMAGRSRTIFVWPFKQNDLKMAVGRLLIPALPYWMMVVVVTILDDDGGGGDHIG